MLPYCCCAARMVRSGSMFCARCSTQFVMWRGGAASDVSSERPTLVGCVYQQVQRWLAAGSFELLVEDVFVAVTRFLS